MSITHTLQAAGGAPRFPGTRIEGETLVPKPLGSSGGAPDLRPRTQGWEQMAVPGGSPQGLLEAGTVIVAEVGASPRDVEEVALVTTTYKTGGSAPAPRHLREAGLAPQADRHHVAPLWDQRCLRVQDQLTLCLPLSHSAPESLDVHTCACTCAFACVHTGMCRCACTCVYICICAYMHVHLCLYVHTRVHVFMHVHISGGLCVHCTHMYMCVCAHMCVHVPMCMCVCYEWLGPGPLP